MVVWAHIQNCGKLQFKGGNMVLCSDNGIGNMFVLWLVNFVP